MKQQIFVLMLGSCIGIGVFLYAVFSWYSGILSVSHRSSEGITRATEEKAPSFSLSIEDKPFGHEFRAEWLGQMLMIGFEGTEATSEVSSLFSNIRPGGVLLLSRNIVNKEQAQKLIADLQEISMRTTGLPLFVAVDQEGGIVSRVPWAEDTPASSLENFEHAFAVAEQRARDLKEVGVNMNLAPVLDSSGEKDFLFGRSFQKDEDSSLAIAQGFILGHLKEGIIPVPKHFPGYDGVSSHPEKTAIPKVQHIPDTSFFSKLFQEIQLPLAMISHVIYEDFDSVAPFPFSPQGIQLFKKELGSEVLVISDDLLSEPFVSAYKLSDIGLFSIQSGVDVLLVAGYPDPSIVAQFYEEFLSAVQQDSSSQSRVKRSFEEIVKMKRELLFRKGNDTVK